MSAPRLLFILALVLCASCPAVEKPNIVILIADDAGWGDCSFNGNTNLSTPNFDSIARDGAVLEHFYVCSVCAPTRAELLTGRYHPRTGVRGVSTGQERMNVDEKTLADAFKAAGYATGAFGKWHNGSQWPYHPNARGFTEYYGFTSGQLRMFAALVEEGSWVDARIDHPDPARQPLPKPDVRSMLRPIAPRRGRAPCPHDLRHGQSLQIRCFPGHSPAKGNAPQGPHGETGQVRRNHPRH